MGLCLLSILKHQFRVASKPCGLLSSVFNTNVDIKLVEGLLEVVPLQQKQVQLKFFSQL
jgi:hypothetical protein